MLYNDEILLFIEELGRLLNDYNKCEEGTIKQEIYKDILLLSDVICSYQ
ncbi:hypothetical protein ACFOU2_10005 [Bacillus songklensis]|uniref:Spo0E like sporulation regulatory protein n=1 Tax=Bacillus songklensis TaxID=1069116 RepID=A0ABV8B3K2_9BACI